MSNVVLDLSNVQSRTVLVVNGPSKLHFWLLEFGYNATILKLKCRSFWGAHGLYYQLIILRNNGFFKLKVLVCLYVCVCVLQVIVLLI